MTTLCPQKKQTSRWNAKCLRADHDATITRKRNEYGRSESTSGSVATCQMIISLSSTRLSRIRINRMEQRQAESHCAIVQTKEDTKDLKQH
jgi:hypothetical protein